MLNLHLESGEFASVPSERRVRDASLCTRQGAGCWLYGLHVILDKIWSIMSDQIMRIGCI